MIRFARCSSSPYVSSCSFLLRPPPSRATGGQLTVVQNSCSAFEPPKCLLEIVFTGGRLAAVLRGAQAQGRKLPRRPRHHHALGWCVLQQVFISFLAVPSCFSVTLQTKGKGATFCNSPGIITHSKSVLCWHYSKSHPQCQASFASSFSFRIMS